MFFEDEKYRLKLFLKVKKEMNIFKHIIISASICITSLSLVCEGSLLCTERKNVTIIPHIDIEQRSKGDYKIEIFFENSAMQLTYLIKSMLETSCFEVWFYSPIQNRCIQQTVENYVRFLETEWMAITSTDDKDILNVLSKIHHSNNEIEQTLLFVSNQWYSGKETLKDSSTFGTHLKEMRNNYNIIILCSQQYCPNFAREAKNGCTRKTSLLALSTT